MSKKQTIVDSYYQQMLKDMSTLKAFTNQLIYPSADEIKGFLASRIVKADNVGNYHLQADRDFITFYLDLSDFNRVRYHLVGRLLSYKNLRLWCYDSVYNDAIKFLKAPAKN